MKAKVPKVACFAIAGLKLWFNSSDHLPPHFHAEKLREWNIRVFFLREPDEMIEVVYSTSARRPNNADLKEIKYRAEVYRTALHAQWEKVVNVTTPGLEK